VQWLGEQTRLLPLDVLHRLAQVEADPIHCVQFDEDYHMGDTPTMCCLNYLINEYQTSKEMRKRRAGFHAESLEDPKSKRVRTGAGEQKLTGELMDSMARQCLPR